MADIGWGHLADLEHVGRPGDSVSDFNAISYSSAKSVTEYKHAAHAMIAAKDPAFSFDLYPRKGAVLMQMRFDGCLGFAGGIVDDGERPLDSLNREMEEEIGLNLEKHAFCESDHVVSHKNKKKALVTHFYAKEVTLEEFKQIEEKVLQAFEYGRETLGAIRVPLFIMGDGYRGLPVFLSNQFAGNARQQLLLGLSQLQLLTDEEIEKAVEAFKKYSLKHS